MHALRTQASTVSPVPMQSEEDGEARVAAWSETSSRALAPPVQPSLEVLFVLRSCPERRVHVPFQLERNTQRRIGTEVERQLDHLERRLGGSCEPRCELIHGRREVGSR